MSILFGTIRMDCANSTPTELRELGAATANWENDSVITYVHSAAGAGVQFYHTHQRSKLEVGPREDDLGNIVSFDGRLDNIAELCSLLHLEPKDSSDSEIVLAAFRRWDLACFSRMVGDWAAVIWQASELRLVLARDPAGTRSLYFRQTPECIQWATHIESLLTYSTPAPDMRYLACFLAGEYRGTMTPYRGIESVSPGHSTVLDKERCERRRFWNWHKQPTIRYAKDEEFEEHFRFLLRQAVARRIGPGAPMVAELSGGLDSATIVLIADRVRGEIDKSDAPLETISYYDDAEPDWDERPYFTCVETARSHQGIHIPISFSKRSLSKADGHAGKTPALPGYDRRRDRAFEEADQRLRSLGCRVVLSGFGGDELLGGVPTPYPELADSWLRLRLRTCFQQTLAWSLHSRTPVIELLWNTGTFLNSLYRFDPRNSLQTVPWGTKVLANMVRDAHPKEAIPSLRWSTTPSLISSDCTWWNMLETLPHMEPTPYERREYRYPYLDRDLAEYLLRVPREQLVRPGQRRSLMRRALVGIVPDKVLWRQRKAFVSRGPLRLLERCADQIAELFNGSALASMGLIDSRPLLNTVDQMVRQRDPTWSLPILNTVFAELWVREQILSPKLA